MKLTVDLGPNSYPIHIENGILAKTGELVSEVFSGKKIMIVSDDNVFPLYGEIITKALSDSGFECHSFVLPHGEPTKSFQSLPKIYEALINAKLTRSDLLIALGGGVIGDLAGFAASSYLRGIKFVQIPTSLLAQGVADAAFNLIKLCCDNDRLISLIQDPLIHHFIIRRWIMTDIDQKEYCLKLF